MYPQSVLCKNKKNIKKNSAENFQFLQLKKNLYITICHWACFHNGSWFSEYVEEK